MGHKWGRRRARGEKQPRAAQRLTYEFHSLLESLHEDKLRRHFSHNKIYLGWSSVMASIYEWMDAILES